MRSCLPLSVGNTTPKVLLPSTVIAPLRFFCLKSHVRIRSGLGQVATLIWLKFILAAISASPGASVGARIIVRSSNSQRGQPNPGSPDCKPSSSTTELCRYPFRSISDSSEWTDNPCNSVMHFQTCKLTMCVLVAFESGLTLAYFAAAFHRARQLIICNKHGWHY